MKENLYTNYLFGNVMPTDELRKKLDALSFKTWSDQNHDLLAAYPANAGSTFDGVYVSKGERDDYGYSEPYEYIEVQILHPNPFHTSQYWGKLDEALAIFHGIKRIARWDWREGARKKALKEQERKEKLLRQGRFHVIQFNCDTRMDTTVLTTDDPVEAYNAYVNLPEVSQDTDCQCKILHLSGQIGGEILERYYWWDQIVRIYDWRTSSFEEEFIIAPHTRCGKSYYERPYSHARRRYYNLLTGKSWVVCPAMKTPSTPSITAEEMEFFKAGQFPEYPIQPQMRDGSVIKVRF